MTGVELCLVFPAHAPGRVRDAAARDRCDAEFAAQLIDGLVKVSIGYGGGGSDFATKNMPANRDNSFGGGAGAGIKITPVAFLVIRGENVRMLPVAEPASTSVDRLIELLPDLLEKGEAYFAEKKAAKEAEKAAEEA